MKIVYLHGFGSVGLTDKSQELITKYGVDKVICPDLPIDPTEIIGLMSRIVNANRDYPLIFVGTSLGGFYANFFAQLYDAKCVLINPSTAPSTTFSDRIGDHKNYVTGETITITKDILDTWSKMEDFIVRNQNCELVSLFVANDDTVLNPQIALTDLNFAKFKSVTETGGHRFVDHWHTVVDHISTLN